MNKPRIINQYNSVYLVLSFLCVAAFIYKPQFMQVGNIYVMLRQAAALGILALGQLFVVSLGGVDLSTPAIIQSSIVVFMTFYNKMGDKGLWVGILLSFLLGIAIGIINGLVIAKGFVQPFLATLFVGAIFVALRRLLTGVTPMGVAPEGIIKIIKGENSGSFPYAAAIFFVACAIMLFVFRCTVFGTKVESIGMSPTASLFSGVRVQRTVLAAYVISAVCAVVSAIMLVGYTGYADQEALGRGMEMDSLVAVVLGGNFLGGGKASVTGVIGGVLATTFIINVVILFGLEIQYQYMIKGIILLAVTFFSSLSKK